MAVCYVSGTRIRTTSGDVAVEDLRVGDLAVTASCAHRPIRWIGRRTVDLRHHPRPGEAMPVRIRADALGDNRPACDLLVSPAHSVCLDLLGEVLIPVGSLVNGATIVQEEVDSVTYWHVELDSHDILVAENQPAESYLDVGNRGFFAHSTTEHDVIHLAALPDGDPAERRHADHCRPFHGSGPLVEVVRAQLLARARTLGWSLAARETWADVHLQVDGIIVRPKARGLSACFLLSAEAKDVWLVSPTSIPRLVADSVDERALGLCVTGLKLYDGLGEARVIAVDDPRLDTGFHDIAFGHRWTERRARLPAALWEGLEGTVFLSLDLDAPALPRWVAPGAAVVSAAEALVG